MIKEFKISIIRGSLDTEKSHPARVMQRSCHHSFPPQKMERRDSECGLYGNDPRCLPPGMSSCRHASFLCHPLRCHSVQSATVPG